jgi:ribonuclease III
MQNDVKLKGNKGFNKVLGDIFEAYVAAVVESEGDEGFAIVEKWLTALWAPKLEEMVRKDRSFQRPHASLQLMDPLIRSESSDPLKVYNPTAKVELQKRIMAADGVRLDYERYKDSIELKGDSLGQNMHFIAVYLTGYGHVKKLLGKGEGKNKVEAGNWAATQAMHGDAKGVVEECERTLNAQREEKRRKKEAEKAAMQQGKE